MQRLISYKLFCLLSLLLFFACDRDRNRKGYAYFPDMMESRAYETYSDNPNFADGKTVRLPVEGTVSREVLPYRFEKTEENRVWAGNSLKSPFVVEMKHVEEGKNLYEKFCYNCHGEQGDGKGFLVTSGKYPYPVASLISEKLKNASRGEIVHVITVGYGVMGAHAPQINQEERWKIAEYVKVKLQGMELSSRKEEETSR
ncbi:MAG: cytochrome c [Marinifilaceae bacterium]